MKEGRTRHMWRRVTELKQRRGAQLSEDPRHRTRLLQLARLYARQARAATRADWGPPSWEEPAEGVPVAEAPRAPLALPGRTGHREWGIRLGPIDDSVPRQGGPQRRQSKKAPGTLGRDLMVKTDRKKETVGVAGKSPFPQEAVPAR